MFFRWPKPPAMDILSTIAACLLSNTSAATSILSVVIVTVRLGKNSPIGVSSNDSEKMRRPKQPR